MSAPSFSSFPPSFSSFPDLDPGPSKRPSKVSKSSKSKRDIDSDEDDEVKRKKHRKSKKEKRVQEQPKDTDEKIKADEDQKRRTENTYFYSDRKGDTTSLYGESFGGNAPNYRPVAKGREVLGIPISHFAVRRSGNYGIEIRYNAGRRKAQPSLTDSSSSRLLSLPPTQRIVIAGDTYKYKEEDGFLRLPSRQGPKNDQSYRSITHAKDPPNSDSDSSSSEAEDYDDSDDSDSPRELTAEQATLKALDQKIKSDPTSISTWLAVLAHNLSSIPLQSKNAALAISEITVSILLRALSAHPDNAKSKSLRVKYLLAGEEIWHESKTRAEWEKALIEVGGVDIWMEWLEWRIRKGGKGVHGVVEDAKRLLKTLGDSESDETGKVRVFWRVAVVLQNAGYTERATAMFQAQAELTFEVPQAMYGLPLSTQLDAFEEFWESEVPRVGEPVAQGWAAWVSSGKPDHVPTASTSSSRPITENNQDPDPYHRWAAQEFRSDRLSRLPLRSSDESDTVDADPYSTILFSDIRDILISLNTSSAKTIFRLAWLSVLGLHIPGFSASLTSERESESGVDDRWAHTHLATPAYLAAIFPTDPRHGRIVADAYAGVLIGREKEYQSGFGPVRCWGYGVLGPLDMAAGVGDSKGKNKLKAGMWGKEDVEDIDEDFVRRVFNQLRLGFDDWEWDVLALAFEAALSIKSAIKLSRTFLSTARESLPHWAAHARLERIRGRVDDARKVYQTVLSSSPSQQTHLGEMWWDWAEMEWLAGNLEEALKVVLNAVGVRQLGVGSVAVLKARRNLEDNILKTDEGEERWKDTESWIKLKALLELLTTRDVSSMLAAFDTQLGQHIEGSIMHESLTVSSLLLLYQHGNILKNPTPPAILRERAKVALEIYPSNSVVLGMFLEGEKGQGVWGRVREMLGDRGGLGKGKDVARRAEEVWIAGWESGRWEGEIERTRSGLAGAVIHHRTRGSPIIWRIYIEFEIRAGQLQRAKKMLFRAIGECPLAKELYLLAFGALRSVFKPHELNGFVDMMAERDLRTRVGLDELLEGWEEERMNEDSEESGDEIEHNAKELRRLMPY